MVKTEYQEWFDKLSTLTYTQPVEEYQKIQFESGDVVVEDREKCECDEKNEKQNVDGDNDEEKCEKTDTATIVTQKPSSSNVWKLVHKVATDADTLLGLNKNNQSPKKPTTDHELKKDVDPYMLMWMNL